jgi:hypothetical protein
VIHFAENAALDRAAEVAEGWLYDRAVGKKIAAAIRELKEQV